ncbi:hypothetical protein GCM10009676_30400 [Prauserella halophila]|uniref:DNA-3-methyladenine glycosylase II n=1 Tax=Prauserella halophila TaxID=185641 RepID=A0ABP4GYI6_9PSEU|nr:DNA-3-methyladenine glycosylase 2 family protein [Prauserella halophila]MCP2234667.1 DNA-3-methyladenine glycosylase II [Prauserella halophila]
MGSGSTRSGPLRLPAAVAVAAGGRDPAVTTQLEPATCDDIELAVSGSVAHVSAPAVGADLWGVDELRLAFLLDGTWRPVGVQVRRRSPVMLELRVGDAATARGPDGADTAGGEMAEGERAAAPAAVGPDGEPGIPVTRLREHRDGAVREGSVREGTVREGGVSQADVDRVVSQVRRMLSLDCDGAAFAAVAGRDATLDGIRRAGPGMRPILFGSPYEAACWAVVCQGLRTEQAVDMYSRVLARHGRVVPVGGRSRVVIASPPELRAVSSATRLSADKRDRLAIVAEAAESGLLDAAALRGMDPAEAIDLVAQLPGIGPLSAELIVARGAGHPDVFPAHDRLLLAAMRELYAHPPAEVAERWRPYRSWASFVIRAAAMLRGGRARASP